jgi:hypothetical protein
MRLGPHVRILHFLRQAGGRPGDITHAFMVCCLDSWFTCTTPEAGRGRAGGQIVASRGTAGRGGVGVSPVCAGWGVGGGVGGGRCKTGQHTCRAHSMPQHNTVVLRCVARVPVLRCLAPWLASRSTEMSMTVEQPRSGHADPAVRPVKGTPCRRPFPFCSAWCFS